MKLRRNLRFSHIDFLVLCWASSLTIFLEPYVLTSGVIVDGFFNFRGRFVGIYYPCVVCIGRQTAVVDDMDEIVHEYVVYQRTQDASLWKS